MAFDFLNDIDWKNVAGTASAVSGLAGQAGSIYSLFQRPNPYKDIPALQQMINDAASSREYMNASVNPEHPFFKNLSALTAEKLQEQAAKTIRELMIQDRRGRARGESGSLINPERRDESRMQALARAFMDARAKSQEMARASLENAAQGFSRMNYFNQPIAQYQGQYAVGNQRNRASAFEGLTRFGEGITMPQSVQRPTTKAADYSPAYDTSSDYAKSGIQDMFNPFGQDRRRFFGN